VPDHDIWLGGRDGYGDAVAHGEDSYHWTLNMDVRRGVMVPSASPLFVASTQASGVTDLGAGAAVRDAVEWTPTSGVPTVFIPSGNGEGAGGAGGSNIASVFRWVNNVMDAAAAYIKTIIPFTGMVLYRYDQDATADPDEEMLWLCNGSGTAAAVLQRIKLDGTFDGGATSAHDVKADRLAVIGSRFCISQGYKFAKCTLDADPGKDASYPTKIPVGRPTYPINEMLDLNGGELIVKGDGIFLFNDALAEFRNILPFQSPHPDHGKGAIVDGRGRAYIPTVDGDLIVMSAGSASQQKPGFTHIHRFGRETPVAPVSALAVDMDEVFLALGPGAQRTQAFPGLQVFTYKDSTTTYTDKTSALTDKSTATTVDMSYLTATADAFYVGADQPFTPGFSADMLTRRTGEASERWTMEYGSAASTWTAMDIMDSTLLLYRSGSVIGIPSNNTHPFEHATPWVKNTVNSSEKYWIRIRPDGVSLFTGATMSELYLIPYRPSLDTDNFPLTSYALVGALPKIIASHWEGNRLVHHDTWTLRAPRIERMVVSRVTYTGSTSERHLAAFSERGVHAMPIGADGHPLRTPYPKLGDYSESGVAFDEHIGVCSGYAFGETGQVEELVLDGEDLQSDDLAFVLYRWDNGSKWYKANPEPKFPLIVENLQGQGSVLHVAWGYKGGSRHLYAPYLTRVYVPEKKWHPVEGHRHESQDFESPPII